MNTSRVRHIRRELDVHADVTPNFYRNEARCLCGTILDQWAAGAQPPSGLDIRALHREHLAEQVASALDYAERTARR